MPTENPRITFTVSNELKDRINEFQFSNRIKNQSQAILALIDKGMNKISESKHDDIHGLDQPYALSPDALRLARIYDELPDEHSKKLLRIVAEHEYSRVNDVPASESAQSSSPTPQLGDPVINRLIREGAVEGSADAPEKKAN